MANLTPRVVKLRQRVLKKTVGQWQQAMSSSEPSLNDFTDMEPPQNIDRDTMSLLSEKEMLALGYTWNLTNIYDASHEKLVGMDSPQSLPPTISALLSVCHDSRMALKKTFTFACGITQPMVFFNFELDTLYLSYKDFHIGSEYLGFERTLFYALNAGKKEDWAKVKFLAIELPVWQFEGVDSNAQNTTPFPPFMVSILRYFPGLKEMSIVLRDYSYPGENDNLTLFQPINPQLAFFALELNQLKSFEAFETYDYNQGQGRSIQTRYCDQINDLLVDLADYVKWAEAFGESPISMPNRLFTKIIIGPIWEEKLEGARQRYLG